MWRLYVEVRGLLILAIWRSWVVVGCDLVFMGIGFVIVIFVMLSVVNMIVDDVDLYEINEVFVL